MNDLFSIQDIGSETISVTVGIKLGLNQVQNELPNGLQICLQYSKGSHHNFHHIECSKRRKRLE